MAKDPDDWYASPQIATFDWDPRKDETNQAKHGVTFAKAQEAWLDPKRVILFDESHSTPAERRYFCYGRVGQNVLTVRFTYRDGFIRIIGAGYWNKGRQIYERENKIH